MNNRKGRKNGETTSKGSGAAGLVIFIAILVIAFGSFLGVSSRSDYCAKCHEMQPYVIAWEKSSHNDTSCLQCHYKPGQFSSVKRKFIGARMHLKKWTQSYQGRRPLASVSDTSCMRGDCHSEAKVQEPIEYANVSFSHDKHLVTQRRGKQLVCTSCHSEIVHGLVRSTTKETCFLCHLKPVEGETLATSYVSRCTNCHNPPAKVIEKNGIEVNHQDAYTKQLECTTCHNLIVSGKGNVSDISCRQCHSDPTILAKFTDAVFIHQSHVAGYNMVCSRCHESIEHANPPLDKPIPADCISCHPNHHEAETLMYNAFSFDKEESYASAEFVSHIECRACHIHKVGDRFDPKGITYLASAQSCSKCHPSRFGNFLEEWKLSIGKMTGEVKAGIVITRPRIEKTPFSAKKKEDLEALLDDAEKKLLLVERGKSAHNVEYCNTLIIRAHDRVNQVLGEIGADTIESKRIEAYRFSAKERCTSCHFGIPDYSTMFGTISFDHAPHLADGHLSCQRCHEFKSRWEPHGKVKFEDVTGCQQCHGEASGCRSCHSGFELLPVSVYGQSFIHKPHLESEGLKCLSCHFPDSENTAHGQTILTKASDCMDCHHGPEQTLTCADCHDVQTRLQSGRIPNSDLTNRSIHNIACEKCHDTSVKNTRTVIVRKCAECHDENYGNKIDPWLDDAKTKLLLLSNLIKRAEELTLNPQQTEELTRISERAKYLSQDKSPGVHNPGLWEEILDNDIKTLKMWLGD